MSFLDRLPFRRRPDGPLNSDGQLYSELWLDQRNARRRIRKRLREGEITSERAEQLQHFAEKGYLILSLDLDEGIFTEIDQAVERLWSERPGEDIGPDCGPLVYVPKSHRQPYANGTSRAAGAPPKQIESEQAEGGGEG